MLFSWAPDAFGCKEIGESAETCHPLGRGAKRSCGEKLFQNIVIHPAEPGGEDEDELPVFLRFEELEGTCKII